jgi:hypothetical protein
MNTYNLYIWIQETEIIEWFGSLSAYKGYAPFLLYIILLIKKEKNIYIYIHNSYSSLGQVS